MSAPDRTPGSRTEREQPVPPERSGWWLALLAIPVLCCAGPVLLAAVGVGSVGALFAAGTGRLVLAIALAVAATTAVVLVVRRGRAR